MAEGHCESFQFVVALDIGTTYSGYSYSSKHEFDTNPLKIQTPQSWIAGESSLMSYKTSSSLLLDNKRKFLAFGFDAESKYTNAEHPENLYFFYRFKMNLYRNKGISKTMKIKDITGRKAMPATTVFSLSIKALKDAFFKLVKDKGLEDAMPRDRILWVITVPAIWPPAAKLFMLECAVEAGLAENQVTIALEPEAGAICCQHHANLDLSSPGSRYLVADLGGGTTDLTVHEKQADGHLKELHKADGIGVGGTNVDQEILHLLSEITDITDLDKKLIDVSQFDLYRAIEVLKRRVQSDSEGRIIFDFPSLTLKDQENYNIIENLGDSVKKYGERHGIEKVTQRTPKHKLSFSADLLKSVFKNTTERIIESIRKVITETKTPEPIKTILVVGGMAECSVVIGEIRKSFEAEERKVIVPNTPGLAILQGAVIYGHDHDVVISRILTHSYGKSVCKEFDPDEHEGRAKIVEDGFEYCINVYDELIAANKELKRGHEIVQIVRTLSDFQPAVALEFFACPNRTPEFVDDPDCSPVGILRVPLFPPMPAGRPIIIKIKFGGTMMEVTAMDAILQIPFTTTLKLQE